MRQRRIGETVLRRIALGVGFGVALFITLALPRPAIAADEGGEAPKTPESSPETSPKSAPKSAPKKKEPPPRPPPIEVDDPPSEALPRWERHIEVGGDVVLMARPASLDGDSKASGVRYTEAIGYGVHGRFDIFRYLRF